jgi:hypothetical protein
MEKVFISSPVYDLIDARYEAKDLFRQMGMIPVLSDSSDEGFEISPKLDSIENCLENVRTSQHYVLLLSQRYGPKLGSSGFEDVSATHLEYREAIRNKKDIYIYVRDRLMADYHIWKKNSKAKDIRLPWVQQKDMEILNFIQELSSLEKSGRPNWYQTFTSSLDLKELIRKDFKQRAGKQNLLRHIAEDKIPIFTASAEMVKGPDLVAATYRIEFKNIGSRIAHNVVLRNRHEQIWGRPIVAPQNQIGKTIDIPLGTKGEVYEEYTVIYQDGSGNEFYDTFTLRASKPTMGIWNCRALMKERKYKAGDGLIVQWVE